MAFGRAEQSLRQFGELPQNWKGNMPFKRVLGGSRYSRWLDVTIAVSWDFLKQWRLILTPAISTLLTSTLLTYTGNFSTKTQKKKVVINISCSSAYLLPGGIPSWQQAGRWEPTPPFSRALERFFQSSTLRGKYLDSRGVLQCSGYARPKFVWELPKVVSRVVLIFLWWMASQQISRMVGSTSGLTCCTTVTLFLGKNPILYWDMAVQGIDWNWWTIYIFVMYSKVAC